MRKVLLVDNLWPQCTRNVEIDNSLVTITTIASVEEAAQYTGYDAISVAGECSLALERYFRNTCKEVAVCRRLQLK